MKYYIALLGLALFTILSFSLFGLNERVKLIERKVDAIKIEYEKNEEKNRSEHGLFRTDIDILMYGFKEEEIDD